MCKSRYDTPLQRSSSFSQVGMWFTMQIRHQLQELVQIISQPKVQFLPNDLLCYPAVRG